MAEVVPSASPFDALKRTDEHGEYWTARDLMSQMAYPRWNEFRSALDRAMAAAENVGCQVDDLFRVDPEKSGGRPREDFRLTRFAAYLVAMNGDPRKSEVAAAQAYFAIRTEQAEQAERVSQELPAARHPAIEAAEISRAQLAMLKVAEGMESADRGWVAVKTRVVISRGLSEEPEISPLDVPLYVPDYLKSKGLTAQQVGSEQSWFGKRVVMVCEEDDFEPPAKRPNLLPNGQIRETRAWAKRHLPYFEAAWDRWFAEKYATPTQLNLVSGD